MTSLRRVVCGLMSGTSVDGVDAAVVRVEGAWPTPAVRLLGRGRSGFDAGLRRRVLAVRSTGAAALGEICGLERALVAAYVAAAREACTQAGVPSQQLDAAAAHGLTLYHRPPVTWQIFDAARLAAGLGCRVVSDFRRADCAAGGQGAPLVPFADRVMFGRAGQTVATLNLGGIANITVLYADGRTVAFDTGPGNCISDYVCRSVWPEGSGHDAGGQMALGGRPVAGVVERALADEFFRCDPPRSTDTPAMLELWRRAVGDEGKAEIADLLASAVEITAASVAGALAGCGAQRVIAAGGGVHNAAMMAALRRRLAGVELVTSAAAGVPPESREAMAFALLGAATLDGVPSNVPAVTGASRAVVLGSVTPVP